MVNRLSKIISQFDEIAKDRDALELRENEAVKCPNNIMLRPPSAHMVDEVSVFGREAEVMEVVDFLLLDKEKHISVISIIGKGGLGKTTIAQFVYKDKRVHRGFDLLGWVCVSEHFDVRRMIKATLESITRKGCRLNELNQLQEQLAKTVKRKRILIVLDDVWNEEPSPWESFQIAFKEAKLVRILMTTRIDKAAEIMQTTAYLRLNYLPEYPCWQLFQLYAFGSASSAVQTQFVEMGRAIMTKCGGLPLAVKSIASVLRYKADEESWKRILESDFWESNPSNAIFPVLQISYAHLPAHLKPCFLFCSMYPKDYKFGKKNLIELWISHGYVKSGGNKRITEVAVEYYEELKGRSFLDDSSDEFSEFCKLHDIIHDFARLNSKNELYSVDINQPLANYQENILREAYHLYVTGFMGYVDQIPQQNVKCLRTLSTDLRGCIGSLEHQHCMNIGEVVNLNLDVPEDYLHCWGNPSIVNLTKFGALRVLELKGDNLIEIPDCFALLKHLSFLRIISDSLDTLPSSIGLLYNLQTFILDCFSSPLEYLPDSIGYLANLQYLCIECAEFKQLPKTFCLLGNLQRLKIKNDMLEELPSDIIKLGNLHELTIDSQLLKAFPDTIGCLSSLEELYFPFVGGLSELPIALANCRKLKTLKIYDCLLYYNPHNLENFPAMRTMVACLSVRTIAWLNNMKDLEGELIIEGLKNMSNLVDAQHADLTSKCKIETLNLCWHNLPKHKHSDGWDKEELRISLSTESDDGALIGDVNHFDLLECLQPHPHLNELVLQGYPSEKLPDWMKDSFSLQAIQEISLIGCDNLQSLPFHNLHTLKHFKFQSCPGIQVLQLDQLPSQLENLEISWCDELEFVTRLHNLEMLAALEINSCRALKSITMDEPQLVESTMPFGNSSPEEARDDRQHTLSLARLVILCCPLLCDLPDEMEQSEPCDVWVYGCGCPDVHSGNPSVSQ
jgi:Leucine-rich repeat (LRR) protein